MKLAPKDIGESVGESISAITGLLTDFPGTMKTLTVQFTETAKSWGDALVTGFMDSIASLWPSLQEWVQEVIDSLLTFSISWKDIGKRWIQSLLDGFMELSTNITEFFSGLFSGLAKSGGNSGVDGSHANGLAYVPYDGYIAELHEGERVLTAEENKNYTTSSSPTFIQNIYSDTTVDRYTLKKDTEDLLAWGGVKV